MNRLARVIAGATLGFSLVLASLCPLVPTALAAAPDVTMVTATTYDVLPEEHRVAVTVEIRATNTRRDTTTRHYYADRAYLAVIPAASHFHLATATGTPGVSVSARGASATVLLLRFGTKLGAGKTLALTLTFEIVDPGGEPDRPLRISPSLVAFEAWAHGTDGIAGSNVRVRLPAGYAAIIGRGPLAGPSTEPDGAIVFESGPLATPSTFAADVFADRPATLVDGHRSTTVAGETVILLIRSWPDDPSWEARIADLLVRGLPALGSAIGTGWTIGAQLEARESITRSAGGGTSDAATFDPGGRRLDIPYAADATAVLHGLAHGWFNGGLVADRWIAEGFAALYAERAGDAIGVAVASPVMTEAALEQARRLNAWVPGTGSDDFGYAAALALARQIAARAGDTGLRDVWVATSSGIGAYQPGGWPPDPDAALVEAGTGAADWRVLLDLLEDRTGLSFEDLWREQVARPGDAALLDARSAARARFHELVVAAGSWTLPRSIRAAMRAWRFDEAAAGFDAAQAVLRQRDDVARAAAVAGLRLPDSLRRAFEGDDGFAVASAEAVTELAVIGAVAEIAGARPGDDDLVAKIGLAGSDPDANLAAARAAFMAGDLDATLRLAEEARATWEAAPEVARGRVVGAALLILAIGLATGLIMRRRSAGRG